MESGPASKAAGGEFERFGDKNFVEVASVSAEPKYTIGRLDYALLASARLRARRIFSKAACLWAERKNVSPLQGNNFPYCVGVARHIHLWTLPKAIDSFCECGYYPCGRLVYCECDRNYSSD